MIEDVKELGSDLKTDFLRNGCVLEDRKLKLLERRPSQRVTAQVAEVACTGHTVCFVGRVVIRCVAPRARSGKGTKIKEIRRKPAIGNRPYHVGTIKSLACPGVVPFEEVVQVKW